MTMADFPKIPALKIALPPRSRTLICSMAVGGLHIACMRWMAPTVRYYAQRHQMDHLLIPLHRNRLHPSRPASWNKVVLLNHMLKSYDTVIWIDADTIMMNPDEHILAGIDPKAPMHVVAHALGRKTIPNTGVWICRNDPRTFKLLEAVWNHTEFVHDGWWEQAALMDMIGYEPRERVCRFRGITPFTSCVHFMDEKWNSRYTAPASKTNIMHFTGPNKPLEEMERAYRTFLGHIAVV
ncbi:putative nucleotide-diphospho-sugar transferase [Paenibacillus ginsengarvi]|uniref:Nucleotide-diphospho-sugar transferase domain-containing protein n=1 Tax=Paenibacillus ginsengarvi TaxID=400777 RepID=A0A3B0CI32_9BACL|nr:putative nucleotide-diphospho-sugar transferase [Paenibacillus ginsengarvi]RKN85325.1 hypothetical protein D7M11_09585 [Paenibacillus ginsengarvi]